MIAVKPRSEKVGRQQALKMATETRRASRRPRTALETFTAATAATRAASPLAILTIVILPLACQLASLQAAQAALQAAGSASVTPASNFELGAAAPGDQTAGINLINSQRLLSQELQARQQQQVSPKSQLNGRQFGDTISDIQIECNSNNIVVTLQTNSGFNGMIYPKGLSKNSSCMSEYHQLASNITYYLPLKSCNTMSTDVEDGVEYFNTVMVQPHRRLVTNQGRGYHIRCRYQTKERTITNQEQQLSVNLTQVTPAVMGAASMPACSMRIYSTSDLQHEVSAENVRIGDELQLVIALDEQDVYGMLVTNCLVRDGMNWGEQPLIDDRGCPVDEEIMPEFVYARNLTRASVTFQAHKFPYTSSVYYQCNVRLCFRDNGCQAHTPPDCSGPGSGAAPSSQRFRPGGPTHFKSDELAELAAGQTGNELHQAPAQRTAPSQREAEQARQTRARRWVDGGELDAVAAEELARPLPAGRDMSIEVSSGLHVAEREAEAAADADSPTAAASELDPLMAAATNDDPEVAGGASEIPGTGEGAKERRQSEREFCMSLRKFAIIISLISLLLMAAIIIMIACLIQRRNRQKLESQLNDTYDHHHQQRPPPPQYHDAYGSSTPYANRAYRHD